MTYQEYIKYHKQGDAGVEERMIASLCRWYSLSAWDSFRLIYYYAMTYNIPSALDMLLHNERDMRRLKFRTDRRYVRCHGAFARLLKDLHPNMQKDLAYCVSTTQAYEVVSGWYYFGRYAAYLFLEVYIHVFNPNWKDDLMPKWEADENYTKGAISLTRSNDKAALDKFLTQARKDTGDNVFSIETSLCAVEKFRKGTRWNGYYTERMLTEARGTEYERVIYECV